MLGKLSANDINATK